MVTDAHGHEITRQLPTTEEVKAFFYGLGGIKHVQNLEAAIAKVQNLALRKAWQKMRRPSRSVDETLAFEYGHPEAIKLLIGRDLYPIMAAAALMTQLPPLGAGARVPDVGGGPGHLALWMLECWPSSEITVLDRVASSVVRQWTPALAASTIRFVDGDVPSNLSAIEGRHFERVIVARTLAQGGTEMGIDHQARLREVLAALKPVVVAGGDLVVIDHYHGQDMDMAQELANIATSVGFSSISVRGWKPLAPEMPWQLRFMNDADVGGSP